MNSNDNQQFYNDFHLTSTIYSDQLQNISSSSENLEHLFHYTPSSPIKQLPMLSSCANYISSSQNSQSDDHLLSFHNYSSHLHSRSSSSPYLLSNDDLFLLKYNENIIVSPTNISNTSSPTKYRVLNTPERPHLIRLTPSPKRDCFNEYLPFPEPIISEAICLNKYDLSINLPEKLGYNPTYTEILIGQTRDQRYITEQARRYLSCSSLNNP